MNREAGVIMGFISGVSCEDSGDQIEKRPDRIADSERACVQCVFSYVWLVHLIERISSRSRPMYIYTVFRLKV